MVGMPIDEEFVPLAAGGVDRIMGTVFFARFSPPNFLGDSAMNRRELLLTAGAAVGLSAFPFRLAKAAEELAAGGKKKKVLFFTRSAGYEHEPVKLHGKTHCRADELLMQWGKDAGFEVVCSKDGAVFDGDLDPFDAFAFYTSGDLTGKCENPQPGKPMSRAGKKKFLAAIDAGKGFVGIHCATDTFRSAGVDPYIAMLGGEFLLHEAPQKATLEVVSPKFPGMEGLGKSFTLEDEWYAFHKFAKDLHVILVPDLKAMHGEAYQRLAYPFNWARMQGRAACSTPRWATTKSGRTRRSSKSSSAASPGPSTTPTPTSRRTWTR